ncbi:AraC family transcriptional regulator ligand-binding domain-containing protein [Methylobacterium oxalidis]
MPNEAGIALTRRPHSRAAPLAMPPSTTGALVRLAVARATAAGIVIEPLLLRTGLTPCQIADRQARVDARGQAALLDLLADAVGDDLFGFHLGRDLEVREVGLVYYLMASAPTLRDALIRVERYSAITNEGIVPICLRTAEVSIRLNYLGLCRHAAYHQAEFWMTGLVQLVRHIAGRRLCPVRLALMHPRRATSDQMEAFVGCAIEFGALVDEIVFPADAGDVPLVCADSYLHDLLLDYCEDALALRTRPTQALRTRIENAVAPILPHGRPRVSEIALRLGMSQRTLSRRLAEEGLTFERILEEMRRDLALRYLQDARISVTRIAWLLGFQEVGAFTHAFRRWTGQTPSAARSGKRPGLCPNVSG